jgi:2-polyprenyl-3-methyl-5-hydroxy-6-metoxy-1,4-benzoquinol methylase
VTQQPTARKELPSHVDPSREFDTTSLRVDHSTPGTFKNVHRDYGAHFFRWGFAGRFSNANVDILDVGCGVDVAFSRTLNHPRNCVPRSYTGVDFNPEPKKYSRWGWTKYYWSTNFIQIHKKLGQFDLVTCFEVLEHMRFEDGLKFIKALRTCLRPGGKILLSTPVFNGKAAANHLHEWTIEELSTGIKVAGLTVTQRFGTFANSLAIKKVARGDELAVLNRLKSYYSDEVLACFLAPLYPDVSRNNVWLLTHK